MCLEAYIYMEAHEMTRTLRLVQVAYVGLKSQKKMKKET